MNKLLWVAQILLALLFAFAGVSKLMMPAEQLTAQSTMSATFLRFISVCEVLGAVGLILPWALRIKPVLTPIAAALLAIIMIGAVVTSFAMSPVLAAIPLITGLLCAFVAWGRWRVTPPAARAARTDRAPATA